MAVTPFSIFNEEKKANLGSHIEHIEDSVFDGKAAAKHAQNVLRQANEFSVKIDGSPSLFFGTDPKTKKFFIATKSLFNAEPKINYTVEDIKKNHGNSKGLPEVLFPLLELLPNFVKTSGIWRADVLFSKPDDLKNNGDFVEVTPNTITYRFHKDEIGSAKIGLAIHTSYYGDDLTNLQSSSEVEFDNFDLDNSDVFSINAIVEDTFDFDELSFDGLKDEYEDPALYRKFINSLLKDSKTVSTVPDADLFFEWLDKNEFSVADTFEEVEALLKAHNEFQKIKDNIVENLDKEVEGQLGFKTFIKGKKTGQEGYVLTSDVIYKLVNRRIFSASNFAEAKTARGIVITFGRFQPPTYAHADMFKFMKTFEQPVNVRVSHSFDKETNPLTQEERIRILKQVNDTITYSKSSKDAPSVFQFVDELNNDGFKNITLVVGKDRLEDFRKALDGIKIVEYGDRQETDVSASKMREAALEDDYETFKTMAPQELDDETVRWIFDTIQQRL